MGDTLRSVGVTLAVQMLAAMAMLTIPVLAPEAAKDLGIAASWGRVVHPKAME